MALKWVGKMRTSERGNQEPVSAPFEYAVPCQDLEDDELREIAKAHGIRRDVLERRLRDTGLFEIVAGKSGEDEEEPAPPVAEEQGEGEGPSDEGVAVFGEGD